MAAPGGLSPPPANPSEPLLDAQEAPLDAGLALDDLVVRVTRRSLPRRHGELPSEALPDLTYACQPIPH